MKFLLFGTGDYYDRYKKWFPKEDVVALLDNSLTKQGTCLDDIPIVSPKEGVQLPFDRVVILSFYVEEMRNQLKHLGVSEDRICHFFDLRFLLPWKELKKSIQYYGKAEEVLSSEETKRKKILLLSHDLNLGGPAIALYYAAVTLRNHGYEAVYASMLDGPLKEKLLAEQIPVVVDCNLQMETMREADWIGSFSLLICNTISYYVFLSERNAKIPVIWWLHDSSFFYDGVNREVLHHLDRNKLKMVSVGPVPREAFCKIVPDMSMDELLYGVEDKAGSWNKTENKSGRIRFVTVGYIEKRKGQDILLQAVLMLPPKLRKQADFCLVGQDTSKMAEQIQEEIRSIPEVRMTGPVNRERMHQILEDSDMMICPSREDPMPTAAAEAMMHGVPCLISNAAGTAAYIQDGVNGLIFQSEHAEELSQKIAWCIAHSEELPRMGARARKVYESRFSIKVFEEKLLEVVEESL